MIYADNAATTRITDSVLEKMLSFLKEQYGNPSSQYSLGTKSKRAIEFARNQVSKAIGAKSEEIIFTSGGSEANNWVFQSISNIYPKEPVHIITSAVEHHSVLNSCHELERRGVDVTYIPVNQDGLISVADVAEAIKPQTKLVSIMYANNEIGTIQPIAEVGNLLKNKGILFHTDAVQAVGHIPVDVSELNVDYLTASAHKFNGAKGTGILYKRTGIDLLPIIFGGSQEHKLRAGTENVAGIVAAGYAIEESNCHMVQESLRQRDLINNTIEGIRANIPSVKVNGSIFSCLPGTINLCFDGVSGESLMHLLDLKGICISTSSACMSGEDQPSHVLLALGLTSQQAKSAIRISYGRYNTTDDVMKIVAAVSEAYQKIIRSN